MPWGSGNRLAFAQEHSLSRINAEGAKLIEAV
jgi:hypothetical protein